MQDSFQVQHQAWVHGAEEGLCTTHTKHCMLLTLLLSWCGIDSAVSALMLWTTGRHMATGQSERMEHGWEEKIAMDLHPHLTYI